MDQRTITLDGVTYEVASFSEGVQQAVTIYNTFSAELQKEQLAVVKTQAAIQNVGNQLAAAIRKELDDKAAAEKAAAETAEATPV